MGSVTTVWWCWMYLCSFEVHDWDWHGFWRGTFYPRSLPVHPVPTVQPPRFAGDSWSVEWPATEKEDVSSTVVTSSFCGALCPIYWLCFDFGRGTWTNIFWGKIWSITPSTLWSFKRLIGSSGFFCRFNWFLQGHFVLDAPVVKGICLHIFRMSILPISWWRFFWGCPSL